MWEFKIKRLNIQTADLWTLPSLACFSEVACGYFILADLQVLPIWGNIIYNFERKKLMEKYSYKTRYAFTIYISYTLLSLLLICRSTDLWQITYISSLCSIYIKLSSTSSFSSQYLLLFRKLSRSCYSSYSFHFSHGSLSG